MTGPALSSSGLFQFLEQVIKGRWFTVFASLFIMAGGGATYIFRNYSQAIVDALGYDEADINTMSFYKDVGAHVAIVAGIIGEVIPSWLMLSLVQS